MSSEQVYDNLKQDIVKVKDMNERKFGYFTDNFYLLKTALRYFTVRQSRPINSTKLSENFPMTTPVAGSCLDIMHQLEVIEKRTKSNSPDLYMPEKADMNRMQDIEKVLLENYEIEEFY